MKYDLEIKSVYDFTLKAGTILGYGDKSATVLALLDFDSANAIEDVTPIHAQIYPQLGAGVPRNAGELTYVKIRTATGQVRVLAMDWIAAQPVRVVATTVKVIVTNINLSQIPQLRQHLLQGGFTKIDISVVT